jgi:alkylhydroperoxidase family enzyme
VPTHITLGRSVGLDEEHLGAIADDAPQPVYSEVEQAVVDYARRLTRMDPIHDALYRELRRHFTLEQIMELCFTVGVSNIINRFHATFHTPLDQRTQDALGSGSPLPLPPPPID